MDSIKQKIAVLQGLNWRLISRATVAVLLAVLLVWVCISTSNTSDMQEKYAAARTSVGDMLYGCAMMMALEYDGASLAGADVSGDILPSMRTYFSQVVVLNNALASAFGEEYAVFDQQLINDIQLAFDEYDSAYSSGHSTDGAEARMTLAMADVRKALSERYDENAKLK